MIVRLRQNGPMSVEVSWEIEGNTNVEFQVCYRCTQNDGRCIQNDEMCTLRLTHNVRTETVDGLQVGVQYTFRVISHLDANSIPSSTRVTTLIECDEGRLLGGNTG